MKKSIVFRGVATALATPFDEKGIDYISFAKMIDHQLSHGVDALVVCGTTGESSTLSEDEKKELISFAVRQVRHRVPVIAGTGCNDTRRACRMSEFAADAGADALLVVTPYYNKGTREGVYKHFEKIAKSTYLPIILYNVPSRTGVDLRRETVRRLSLIENIVGIKEAKGIPERLADLVADDALSVYTGTDGEMLDILELGGSGVISVVSNLYPKTVMELYTAYYRGDKAGARKLFDRLKPIISALFIDTNPAPIKYALARLGLADEEMRLPMYPIDKKSRITVDNAMDAFGIE